MDKRPAQRGDVGIANGRTAIDETDRSILRHLLRDGRASMRQMGTELGLSPTTVASRVARLEKERVVRGYTGMVDSVTLGYDLTAVTEILVSKGKLLEMEKEIARIPNALAVYDVTGDTDAIIVSKFKNMDDLSVFTKKLLSMPYVERTNTHMVLTSIKEDLRLSP